MAIQTGVWGIDLGQCGLKAIRLVEVEGVVQATAFDYIEHPKILSQPDADPDQLTREALVQFLSRNNLRGDMVVISVPGRTHSLCQESGFLSRARSRLARCTGKRGGELVSARK